MSSLLNERGRIMSAGTYFHGANGDKILSIIATGQLRPNEKNEVFCSRFRWESCLMHGADLMRKASFVIKVSIETPADVGQSLVQTPGVRDTVVFQTDTPLPAKVLELFVRRLHEDGAQVDRILGEEAIIRYLNL
jgi:hypothetical protein